MSDENVQTETPMNGSDKWSQFITPFAAAIGKSPEDVTEALKALVGEPSEASIELLQSVEYTPEADIKSTLQGVPAAVLKRAIATHLRSNAVQQGTAATVIAATPSLEALPSVPDDEAWLATLKTGGELKVDSSTVISAVRAALAARSGLYDLPSALVERMESYAESLDEPVGEEFFKLRKLLTQRSYAEIFSALGIEGQFVSQRRKDTFVEKLNENLWPALLSFQGQLREWTEAWQQGMANPAAMMGAFAVMAGGGAMPPGMMQPPATEGLRDYAEGVNDQVNRVFGGVGIPIARALAYDAHRIKQVLENPTLPLQVGAANRDQMLKMLGVDVSADYVRLERNLTRYMLGIMEYPKVTAGAEELGYLTSLLMLGSQIPWDKLGSAARFPGSRSGGGRRRATESSAYDA